jgi:hypothetical protein
MQLKKIAATFAALVIGVTGSLVVSDPAHGNGLVPIAKPAPVVEETRSAGTPPAPTKNDKPYKASKKEKAASKSLPSDFRTFACPCFSYAIARQIMPTGTSADGLAANLPVENNYLKLTPAPADYHTLAQLHVKNASDEAIEFGITVDKSLFGDTQARLFAGYRKDGIWQGYGVGFVDYAANTTNTYGTAVDVVPGTQRRFEVKYSGGNWWLAYNLAWIGYIPGSAFGTPNTFINGNLFQAFLEVAHPNTSGQSCTDMGNGLPVSSGTAARIGTVNLTGLNPPGTPFAFTGSVDPSTAIGYNVSYQGGNTWRAGGPGANAALTGVGTTGSC